MGRRCGSSARLPSWPLDLRCSGSLRRACDRDVLTGSLGPCVAASGWAMADEPTLSRDRASRALRNRFRDALDADDYAALRVLSADLRDCTDILPRSVCLALGLPRGSTYSLAAVTIVTS